MKTFRHLILMLLASFVPLTAMTQDGEDVSGISNQQAAEKLAAILRDMQTLQADVEQLTLDQDGREIQVFEARLLLHKPDNFSWEITSPYSELLVTDGARIWRYEPDLEQVTIELFQNDLDRTPVLLLNGDASDIADSFTVSSTDMDYGSRQRFILHPKAPDSLFERLSLTFVGIELEEMQFEDSLGQKTSLTFSSLEINDVLDPGVFTFHIPADVEVIDNTGD